MNLSQRKARFPTVTLSEARKRSSATSGDQQSSHSMTLHDSEETPGKLSYLFLFHEANPRCDSDGIIYTKFNLELLPPATTKTSFEPIKEGTNLAAISTSEVATQDERRPMNHVSKRAEREMCTGLNILEHVISTNTERRHDAPYAAKPEPVHNCDMTNPVAVFKAAKGRRSGARNFASRGLVPC
ncbi:hypothetical protein BAUCODRAFT_173137 [Baudoinia panamericana UAMH 10762]|uniref:Uncharacterized protein n=1 Tax=Baudoinia panamericana (strain UAMH 10762) TaxID=717646 RepID=M2M0M5_BAUPA|nr:uncharacterized protein BAUCODRAFT_173137 [Baudoinia panamericana UAMH 10762]EMD00548.1 hypothetical protein BAUCODRAFT_173137 [Baudoinia panamericana UAMH 10762]